MADKIDVYDTTLRDGSQMEGISFSVEDKVRIARRLDAFGVDFIEGGLAGGRSQGYRVFRADEGRQPEACEVGRLWRDATPLYARR